jgi:Mrp family chromosome partitioning ATPase
MSALDQAFIRAYTPAATSAAAVMEPPTDQEPQVSTLEPAAPPVVEPAVAPPPANAPAHFQPAFQVEQFAWSPMANRLSLAAGIQLDRLADGLSAGLAEGHRVVALGACTRGEGCTTLVQCAARRLSQRGLKVILVDADFQYPCLARRLGLLPQAGWEDVLIGRVPLEEAIIESLGDRLDVLPLRGLSAEQDFPAGVPVDPAASLTALRDRYDLVLLDLGSLEQAAPAGQPLEAAARWIDGVVLVHNVRSTPQAELTLARNRLQAAGIAEAGIAENFV